MFRSNTYLRCHSILPPPPRPPSPIPHPIRCWGCLALISWAAPSLPDRSEDRGARASRVEGRSVAPRATQVAGTSSAIPHPLSLKCWARLPDRSDTRARESPEILGASDCHDRHNVAITSNKANLPTAWVFLRESRRNPGSLDSDNCSQHESPKDVGFVRSSHKTTNLLLACVGFVRCGFCPRELHLHSANFTRAPRALHGAPENSETPRHLGTSDCLPATRSTSNS